MIRAAQAERDVAEIWHYIAEDSLAAADHWLDHVESVVDQLADHPWIGRARDELGSGIRSVPVFPYLIFYRVQPDRVEILRIVHGARDLPGDVRQSLGN